MIKRKEHKERPVTLEEYVISKNREGKSKFEVLKDLYEKINEGNVKLVDPLPPKNFEEYVIRLDYSLWFWIVLGLTTLTTIIALCGSAGLTYIKYILGAIYVMFLPGYVTIEAIYSNSAEIKSLEMFTLGIILSIAIVTLLGFIINLVIGGVILIAILAALDLYIVTLSLYMLYKKYTELSSQRIDIS